MEGNYKRTDRNTLKNILRLTSHQNKDSKEMLSNHIEVEVQALLDAFPFQVMLVDVEHRILIANRATRDALGLDPEQIIGEYCPEVINGLKNPYPGCPLNETIKQNQCLEREFFNSETNQWTSSAICPTGLSTRDGREIFIHFLTDITQRKKNEEEILRVYQLQTVLNKLLSISLENISIQEMLEQFIHKITSIPWLALESKGSIFLVEDESGLLVIKAHHGLSKSHLETCDHVPYGRCLCGRAASTGEIVFSDCIDNRHENHYEGITPHGHYCIPIKSSENKVLGVINLYLKPGHKRDQREEDFLTSVANTLAGIIELKQTIHALKKREKELEIKTITLGEVNTALKVLLKRREEDRTEIEEKVLFNKKELVDPYME